MDGRAEPDALSAALNSERRLPRFDPRTVRAAWWAWRSVRAARSDLATDGLRARVAPPPATLPWGARTGVNGVLNRLSPTCLEGALVLQRWLSAHGIARHVVVGVARDAGGAVTAHAWIDGIAAPDDHANYTEIHRIEPPR